MSKYDKEFEEMIVAEENLLSDLYNAKLKHLDTELKVRTELGDSGFRVIEPKFEYENTPSYIEHQKRGLVIAVQEEKAKVYAALNNIARNKLQRAEIAEMKKEREESAK